MEKQGIATRNQTASDEYALVPKRPEDDILTQTYQSFRMAQGGGMDSSQANENTVVDKEKLR